VWIGTIPERSRAKQVDEDWGDEGSKHDLLLLAYDPPREVELETASFGSRRRGCIGDGLQEEWIRFDGEVETSDVLEGEEGGETRVISDEGIVVVDL